MAGKLLAGVKAQGNRALGGQFATDQVKRLPRRLLSSARPLPDFLVIGAQKSGSTTLYDYLVQHPQVRAALTKEVHYFDNNFRRGAGWYRSNFPLATQRQRTWLTGEASPYYLLHPLAAGRAASTVPRAKILVTLRHPVDRTYSHYQHERAKGFETLPLTEALAREEARTSEAWEALRSGAVDEAPAVQHHTYLARSRYDEQIARWLEHYPSEHLLAIPAEELFRDPAPVLRRVFTFLGLDPDVRIEHRQLNARSYDDLSPVVRRRLNEHFRPSVERLQHLVGVTFDWEL
jgi:Sulfotransferase domain